jgi:NAD-dependent dihydropyrimidine dehydrogenase PreA subunit
LKDFRYISNAVTLRFEPERCVGCGLCATVCPHGVFRLEGQKAALADREGCMECGACVRNCPTRAIGVNPGVGCAAYIVSKWIYGEERASCCGGEGGDCC